MTDIEPPATSDGSQYDAILDMLISQDKEVCEIIINTSVSASAVRKALKTRLDSMLEGFELLEVPFRYKHVTVSGTSANLTIKLYESYQDHRTKDFTFTIVGIDDKPAR
jgi:hypothetical protein